MPTHKQIAAARAAMHRLGLLRNKDEIVESYTNNRTSHLSEMTDAEIGELITWLNQDRKQQDDNSLMVRKLFAMAHEMGWIAVEKLVHPDGSISTKKNYKQLHGWVEHYGYLRKKLNRYSHNELPKLITQFEQYIYNPYIAKLKTKTDSNSPL